MILLTLYYLLIIFVFGFASHAVLSADYEEVENTNFFSYDDEVRDWETRKVPYDDQIQLNKDQINYHINIQMTWTAVLFGSIIGLFEMIQIVSDKKFFSFIVYIVLCIGIQFGLYKVLRSHQVLVRKEMQLFAAIRVKNDSELPRKNEFSIIQKTMLDLNGKPTLIKWRLWIVLFVVWIGCITLLFNELGAFPAFDSMFQLIFNSS